MRCIISLRRRFLRRRFRIFRMRYKSRNFELFRRLRGSLRLLEEGILHTGKLPLGIAALPAPDIAKRLQITKGAVDAVLSVPHQTDQSPDRKVPVVRQRKHKGQQSHLLG